MARNNFNVSSGEVAYVAATAKTGLQIKSPANQRVLVKGFSITGKAAAGGTDVPAKVRITRNSASFGTGTTATPGKTNPSTETVQSTAASNFTVEPTTPTDAGLVYEVSPQGGLIIALDEDEYWQIPGGQSLQFEVTSPAAQTFVITAFCEE